MTGVPLTIGAFIVVIGVLIFIHEAGHFVVAKAVGIQVLRFSLGFGRPILSWRRGETEYWISWIPFGGYVKMAGLEDEGVTGQLEGGRSAQPIDPARAFDRRPVWARLLVVCAGVTMNVVLAFVVYAVLAGTVGTPELETTTIDSVEATHLPAGARALASLAAGDRILRIDDDTVRTWSDVMRRIVTGPSELRFGIAGRDAPVVVRFGGGGLAERQAVAEALVPEEQVTVQRLEADRPAARAGLEPGDVVRAVDGVPVRSVDRFLERIWTSAGRPLAFDVRRGGA
ncbi:MAG TPA: RIP metalloprotease RseP, partial [Gemmatimonadales bacterium]|nr:RIP metalloprotease RseP [Gemmatimonadales bacterium]